MVKTSKGTVLVTGASSGIGEALARKFAKQGFDLVITARREDKLTELADALARDVTVNVIASDLSSPEGVDQLLAQIVELGLDIDILINNAGVASTGEFKDMDSSTVDNMLMLNVQALTRLTHALLPTMVKRGAGRILNVASVAAFQPVPSMSVYAATKAYVLSFTEALSEELRGTGVYVCALCPGLTRTEMVDDLPVSNIPPMAMSTAEDVAREGYDAVMNREVIRIPGALNQAAVTWAQYQPRWLVRGLGGVFSRFNPNNQ